MGKKLFLFENNLIFVSLIQIIWVLLQRQNKKTIKHYRQTILNFKDYGTRIRRKKRKVLIRREWQ